MSVRVRENKLKLKQREMKYETTDPWAPGTYLLTAVLLAEVGTVTNWLH